MTDPIRDPQLVGPSPRASERLAQGYRTSDRRSRDVAVRGGPYLSLALHRGSEGADPRCGLGGDRQKFSRQWMIPVSVVAIRRRSHKFNPQLCMEIPEQGLRTL